ncbi:MAG: polysaccharide deacetylase family protein [Patescibacteria group bacterium]|mgnify:FL=1
MSEETTKPGNILTFDIEEWYHANYERIDFRIYETMPSRLGINVDKIIEICDRHQIKATCFIVGTVAENNPQLVKKLHNAGHEIASHGYQHKLIYEMTPDEFYNDAKKSVDILEDLIGEKVLGFRAPSWSVKKDTLLWFYQTLENLGLRYSSSVYPGQTFLYGIPDFPAYIHHPRLENKLSAILEVPVPVTKIMGKKIGFSGGFYLRFFPSYAVIRWTRQENKNRKSIFFYLHPREIDPTERRLPLPLLPRIIQYWGVNQCEKKLQRILGALPPSFYRMKELLQTDKNTI